MAAFRTPAGFLACLALAILCTLPMVAHGFHFYLEPGSNRCFVEQLPKDTLVVGEYRLLTSNGEDYVEDPQVGVIISVVELTTRHLLLKLRREHAGRFAFTSNEAGDHEICLRTNQTAWIRTSVKGKMYFDLTIGERATRDDDSGEKLSSLATQIRDINGRVIDVRREQHYQKEQEEIFRDTSERLNSHVVWFAILQVVVLVLTSAVQMRYLTSFFHSKKVA